MLTNLLNWLGWLAAQQLLCSIFHIKISCYLSNINNIFHPYVMLVGPKIKLSKKATSSKNGKS